MAERSAAERIELWFQQFDHALKMSRDQFYSNAMAIYVQPALSLADHIERFREAGELVGLRADYLRDNPAEVVQDRREAFAERAWDILQRTAEHPRSPSRADSPGEEAQGGAPAPPRPRQGGAATHPTRSASERQSPVGMGRHTAVVTPPPRCLEQA